MSRPPAGPDRRGGHPDFSRWIVNGAEPRGDSIRVEPPAPGIAHVELYDGTTADVEVHVIARRGGMLCVRQQVERDGVPGDWLAWVPAAAVRRR